MRDFVAKAGLAGVASLVLALVIPVMVMVALFPITSDMPQWDQWSMAPVFEAHYAGRPVLPLLLAHYNGHYNWAPRFAFYGMGLLSRWDTRLEVLVGFFCAGCTLLLMLRMLWETSPRLLVLAAPFAAWIFSVLQYGNFLNGYGMGQLLATFAGLLTLYLLGDPGAGRVRFGLAVLSAVVAFTSHGAGIALAPASVALLLLIGPRRDWKRIGAWLVVAAGGVALGAMSGSHQIIDWSRVPRFALTLLGRPFTTGIQPVPSRTALVGAAVALAVLAVIGHRVRHEWTGRRDWLVRWTSVALLALTAIGFIALSRARAPFEWAQSTHYVTSTYPVGLALMALTVDRLRGAASSRGRWSRLAAAGLVACVVAPVAQQAVNAYRLLPVLRSWHGLAQKNVRRLAAGTASDADVFGSLHPVIPLVRNETAMLRTHRLAWFAHAPEADRPFGGLDLVSGQPATPKVHLKKGTAWVFEGWALPPLTALQKPVEVAVLVEGWEVAAGPPDRPRPDLQEYYASQAFLMHGFALTVADGAQRPAGRYRTQVVARTMGQSVTLSELVLVVAP